MPQDTTPISRALTPSLASLVTATVVAAQAARTPAQGPATPDIMDGIEGELASLDARLPEGLTPRMEAFCHAFVERPVAYLAAVAAGYALSGARQAGSRLLRVPAVAARIRELRHESAATNADERELLIAKLECVIAGAIEDHHWLAAARAVQLQAALAGMVNQPRLLAHSARPDDRSEDTDSLTPVTANDDK